MGTGGSVLFPLQCCKEKYRKCKCRKSSMHKCKAVNKHECTCNIYHDTGICKSITHTCRCNDGTGILDTIICRKHLSLLHGYTMTDDCSICMISLSIDTETPLVKTECSHVYHVTCLKVWLKLHLRCPLCNYSWTEVEMPQKE